MSPYRPLSCAGPWRATAGMGKRFRNRLPRRFEAPCPPHHSGQITGISVEARIPTLRFSGTPTLRKSANA